MKIKVFAIAIFSILVILFIILSTNGCESPTLPGTGSGSGVGASYLPIDSL